MCADCAEEVRFKEYGLDVIEVVDNGSGIAPGDYDAIGKSAQPLSWSYALIHLASSAAPPLPDLLKR